MSNDAENSFINVIRGINYIFKLFHRITVKEQ